MFGSTAAAPPPEKKVANIDSDQVSSNQQAIPVRYVLGRTRAELHQIAPIYNKRSEKVTAKTGKDETATIGYIWYGDFAGIWCAVGRRVPLARLYKIIFDSQIVWESTSGLIVADPYSPVTVAEFGAGRVYGGRPTQPQDDLVLKPTATTIPPGVNPRDASGWPNGDETKNHP